MTVSVQVYLPDGSPTYDLFQLTVQLEAQTRQRVEMAGPPKHEERIPCPLMTITDVP